MKIFFVVVDDLYWVINGKDVTHLSEEVDLSVGLMAEPSYGRGSYASEKCVVWSKVPLLLLSQKPQVRAIKFCIE